MIKACFITFFTAVSVLYSLKELAGIQQNAYRMPLYDCKKRTAAENSLIAVFGGAAVLAAVFSPLTGSVITLIALSVSAVYFSYGYAKMRTKFKFTPRGIRLFSAVTAVIILLHAFSGANHGKIYLVFTSGFILLLASRPLASMVNFLIRPFEKLNNKRYIKAAAEKLDGINAVKIGITGSFGKTSCKNILAAILSKKYKVLKTAGNYNTPMGICLAAKEIKGDEEIFIAEMGARKKGDIKELAGIVKPSYAIVTGVSSQHLASFKREENIYNTKKELIDSLPVWGAAVFNGDNEKSLLMSAQCRAEKTLVYLENPSGIHAESIRLTNSGSRFEIVGIGEPFEVSTRLLGRHNILNILMCAALAAKLEVPKNLIAEAVGELKPAPHRLELVENSRSITIIDDSYNANIDGAMFALEVVKQFEGRKVIFTQGIVELGKKQEEINIFLGTAVASVADIVILTGENTAYIYKGLNKAGFTGDIHKFKSLKEAQDAFSYLLRAGDVLLIQNDIP